MKSENQMKHHLKKPLRIYPWSLVYETVNQDHDLWGSLAGTEAIFSWSSLQTGLNSTSVSIAKNKYCKAKSIKSPVHTISKMFYSNQRLNRIYTKYSSRQNIVFGRILYGNRNNQVCVYTYGNTDMKIYLYIFIWIIVCAYCFPAGAITCSEESYMTNIYYK